MSTVTGSTFYSYSCSYPHSYSSPSLVVPMNFPLSRSHGRSPGSNCSVSCRRRTSSNDHSSKKRHKSRFCMYGYGFGYGIIHGRHQTRFQASQASQHGSYDEGYQREESRWLREEQRWLREEQRWLREEGRWNAERGSLLREISHLNLKIQHLEMELEGLRDRGDYSSSVPETLSRISALLQVLGTTPAGSVKRSSSKANQNVIPEYSDETSKPLVLEHTQSKSEPELESHKPVPQVSAAMTSMESKKKSKLSLKMGSEGEEVRELQEALMSLGFYSGEEDMEYSSFSSGTQRAVKTWQASIGATEDGIMTAELLNVLDAAQQAQNIEAALHTIEESTVQKQDKANGVPKASVTEVREVQQTVVKKGPSDVEISQHRVFLLGENRWEEPSRLNKTTDKQANGVIGGQVSSTKCRACRGEGRMLCMECDGTGEPNVEEQFLEWVEEGAKCPYCEGLGYTACDVCDGKAVA